MLIFNNNKPIKQKRWINTKVEFIWDGSQYVEQSAEGYWYDGEMALCSDVGDGSGEAVLTINASDVNSNCQLSLQRDNSSDGVWQLSHGRSTAYGGDDHQFQIRHNIGGVHTWFDRNGDLGVGVNSSHMPLQGKLHVLQSADAPSLHLASSATTDQVLEIDAAASTTGTVLDVNDCNGLTTGLIAYFRSNSADASSRKLVNITNDHTSATGTTALYIKQDSTGAALVTEGGKVGIGTASPGYNLEVNGTFYSAGSSVDFKKHVTDMDIDSSAIYDLNPVSYEYKKDYENFGYDLAGGKQVGLLSEDVANTVPELAIMKDGKAQNVDYQKLSVLLLAEMKKLNKRLEALEAQ